MGLWQCAHKPVVASVVVTMRFAKVGQWREVNIGVDNGRVTLFLELGTRKFNVDIDEMRPWTGLVELGDREGHCAASNNTGAGRRVVDLQHAFMSRPAELKHETSGWGKAEAKSHCQ